MDKSDIPDLTKVSLKYIEMIKSSISNTNMVLKGAK